MKLDLCYTVNMDGDRHIWDIWARNLHRWGMEGLVSVLLESAGPLAIIGAQIVYIGQPLLSSTVPDEHLKALVRLLEDTQEARAFTHYLREAAQS